jgi:hypothetical protein
MPLLVARSLREAFLDLGPSALWMLDEGTGTQLRDAMGANHLTISATYTLRSRPLSLDDDASVFFDGTSGRADKTGSTLNFGTAVSVAVLLMPSSVGPAVSYVACCGVNGNFGYRVSLQSGIPKFTVGNGTTTSTAGTVTQLSTTRPSLIVGTYDNAAPKMYLNGALNNTGAGIVGPVLYTGGTDFVVSQIEGTVAGRYFPGNIGTLAVFNKALSAADNAYLGAVFGGG